LRGQARQKQLQERLSGRPDVRLPKATQPLAGKLPEGEKPCFAISEVSLAGESAGAFRAELQEALQAGGFRPGMCLGARGISWLLRRVEAGILKAGFVTTRVFSPSQSLSSGKVVFEVVPGKIRQIRFAGVSNPEDWHGNAARTQYFHNEFPMREGDLLNIHDMETALENLRRPGTVSADFTIVPTGRADESDIVADWRQAFPLRLTLSADDSGDSQTGKYQGTAALSWDNPLGLSDTFYLWRSHDLGRKKTLTDNAGGHYKSSSEGYGFSYSVPFGNWLFAYRFSHSAYNQAVAGAFTPYLYSGWTDGQRLVLSRLLGRNAHGKLQAGLGVWARNSRNYINGEELGIQHRRDAGWLFDFSGTGYLGEAVLKLALEYKQGTGADRATKAPEEDFGEGTSRMRLVTGDLSLGWPFALGGKDFSLSSALHVQSNRTPLEPQDRISIGSRFTVRGFSGNDTLMAERGYWWRNEFAWHWRAGQQIYLLWDAGQVQGPSTKWLPGTYLEGAGIGLRGELAHEKSGSELYYDLFAARPLKRPDGFPDDGTVTGFSVSLSF
jgi:hemolysin activation/secretion protein